MPKVNRVTKKSPGPDVLVINHGSLVLIRPLTSEARMWLHENVSEESMWFGGALMVEPRYVDGLLEGMMADGFKVY